MKRQAQPDHNVSLIHEQVFDAKIVPCADPPNRRRFCYPFELGTKLIQQRIVPIIYMLKERLTQSHLG